MSVQEAPAESERAIEDSGLAHLAAVSFLASRLAPTAGYWIALPGGVAVARAASRHGLRTGCGASIAALAQSTAVMGPARLSIPFTQAASAPLVGVLDARGAHRYLQMLVVALVRFTLAVLGTAFFIWVILGGLDAFAGGYDWITSWLAFLPDGGAGALVLALIGISLWSIAGSVIQVVIYRRGLRRWPSDAAPDQDARPTPPGEPARRRLDPRAVAMSAVIAFGLLLLSADKLLLITVGAWLAVAWAIAQPDRDFVRVGIALAALLGFISFFVGVIGGLSLEDTIERGIRAAMLVAVATWFRAAAGTGGIREVSRRVLGRLRRIVPGAREATRMLGDLGSGAAIVPTARELSAHLRHVERKPIPLVDAVTGWVATESHRFRPAPPVDPPRLGIRPIDVALMLAALLPAIVLITGVAPLGSA